MKHRYREAFNLFIRFIRLFIGGAIGTLVLTGLIYFLSLSLNLKPNLVGLIEFGVKHSDTVAYYSVISVVIFILFGAIIFPIMYGFLLFKLPEYKLFRYSLFIGVCFSLTLWVTLEVILIPLLIKVLDFDFLTSQIASVKTAFVCFCGFIGYGASLGAIAGNKKGFRKI